MADFTLKKHKDFVFNLDGEGKTYTLPAWKRFSFEDGQLMTRIDAEKNVIKKGKMVKDFILQYAPDLESEDLGDMEYFEIFNAYALQQGSNELGESLASSNS